MPRLLFLLILLVSPAVLRATHIRGGEIRVVSSEGLKCVIEITMYTNTGSDIKFGDGVLSFGDGSEHTAPPIDNEWISPKWNIGYVSYKVEHTYPSPGIYKLSYVEPNLSAGILNMANSVETKFSTETIIVLSGIEPYSSPEFKTLPILICQSGQAYSFSTAAINDDPQNRFYYKYAIVNNPAPTTGYKMPEKLKINGENGIVTWDTRLNGQLVLGPIWVVVRVEKHSRENGFLGYVFRSIMIISDEMDSSIDFSTNIVDANNKVVAIRGEQKEVKLIFRTEAHVDQTNYESRHVWAEVFLNESIKDHVSIQQYDSVGGAIRVVKILLVTTESIESNLPYAITIRGGSFGVWKDYTFLYMTKDVDLPNSLSFTTGLVTEQDLKVYPNPFRSELVIEGPDFSEATLTNNLGQVVITSTDQQVNTDDIEPGFYILEVINKQGIKKKFKVIRNQN